MSDSILLTIDEQVVTITLSRLERLISFNPSIHQALSDAPDLGAAIEAKPEFKGS